MESAVAVSAPNEASATERMTEHQRSIFNKLVEAGWEASEAADIVLEHVEEVNPYDQLEGAAPEEARTRFEVKDPRSADWVLKKIAQCEADEAELEELAAEQVRAINDRLEAILRPIRRKREFFELAYGQQLEAFAREKLEGQKARSVKLIHGDIGFRKGQDKLVVDIDSEELAPLREAALDELEALCPVAVKTERSVLKDALKKLLKDAGRKTFELPKSKFLFLDNPEAVSAPGDSVVIAHIEEGKDNFYTKPKMPEAR